MSHAYILLYLYRHYKLSWMQWLTLGCLLEQKNVRWVSYHFSLFDIQLLLISEPHILIDFRMVISFFCCCCCSGWWSTDGDIITRCYCHVGVKEPISYGAIPSNNWVSNKWILYLQWRLCWIIATWESKLLRYGRHVVIVNLRVPSRAIR